MLLDRDTLSGLADGSLTLAFRRWKRPTVKAGGTLLTAIGQLRITAVEPIALDDIDEADARSAGFEDVASLRDRLNERKEGRVYRIALGLEGPDPRIALREMVPSAAEMGELRARLGRWPWAFPVLRLICDRPAVRAAELAEQIDMDARMFKANVRKLKGLGLTESLEVGYRLSRRGAAMMEHLRGVAE